MRLVVGTCGFSKARRLIFENLDGVELQQTFYDPPSPERLRRLREEAPPGFVFTIKAWMLVTHKYNKMLWRRLKRSVPGDPSRYGFFQDTEEVWWAWDETLRAAEAVGAEAIVLQTPASFRPDEDNLSRIERFLWKAPRRGFLLVWEPRGEWWAKPHLLREISEKHSIVIAGDWLRGRVAPFHANSTAYARLHGLGGREVNYKYKYTPEDLRRLAQITARLASEGVENAYIMFNNVYSYDDAVLFKSIISGVVTS